MSVNDSYCVQASFLTQKMGFTRKFRRCGLLLAVVIAVTYAQVPTGPKPPAGFPSRPSLNIPNLNPNRSIRVQNPFSPPNIRSFLSTYCQLKYTPPFKDPTILETSEVVLNAARDAGRRALNTSQRVYLDGKRLQTAARDKRRNEDKQRGGPAVSLGRSKRQTGEIALLAPTQKTSVCRSIEKVVQSVYSQDEACYLFEEEEILYWECDKQFAALPNTDIKMQRYYCESDNYVHQSVMSYCPDSKDIRWVTVYVPISCCARRYSCDFTPYSSIDGQKRF